MNQHSITANGQPGRKKVPRIFYLASPVLALFLVFGLAELSLIVFYPIPFFPQRNMYFDPDPFTGYRMRPNGFGRLGKVLGRSLVARTNSHGHRDDETTLRKPEGTFRVLVLGDSMTFGTNVRQEEAYPQVLETLLAERLATTVEVIGTGVPGWAPFQYAQYYIHYGHEFAPDLILVGFFIGNDTYNGFNSVDQLPRAILGRRVVDNKRPQFVKQLKILLAEHSHLGRLIIFGNHFASVEEDLPPLEEMHRDTGELPKRYRTLQAGLINRIHLPASPSRYAAARNSVDQIGRVQSMSGGSVPVIVVLMPDENQINASLRQVADSNQLDFSMPQSMLKEMFEERGLRTIDLLPDFLADERRLYLNDSHWTPAGHGLAARRISEVIHPLVQTVRQAP